MASAPSRRSITARNYSQEPLLPENRTVAVAQPGPSETNKGRAPGMQVRPSRPPFLGGKTRPAVRRSTKQAFKVPKISHEQLRREMDPNRQCPSIAQFRPTRNGTRTVNKVWLSKRVGSAREFPTQSYILAIIRHRTPFLPKFLTFSRERVS